MGLHNGIAQWDCTVGLHSGIAQWDCTMGLHSGIAQWDRTVGFFGLKINDWEDQSIGPSRFLILLIYV